MSETTSLKYYNESDIQSIADTIRDMTGSTSTLKVSDMSNFLQNTELKDRRVPVINRCEYVKYFDDISPYRNGVIDSTDNTKLSTNHTNFPLLSYEDGTDYSCFQFCGWFSNEACTTSINLNVISGAAYARFVPIDFFRTSVIFEEKEDDGTVEDPKIGVMKSMYAIRDLQLSTVGTVFKKLGTDNERINKSSTVYQRVNSVVHTTLATYAQYYLEYCNCFKSFNLTGVPKSQYDLAVKFTPYIVTRDGTEMRGIPNIISGNNYNDKIILLPLVINFADDITITSFSMDVSYDSTLFTFEGFEDTCPEFVVNSQNKSNGVITISGTASSEFSCKLKTITFIKLKLIIQTSSQGITKPIPDLVSIRILNQVWNNQDAIVHVNAPDLFVRSIRYAVDLADSNTSNTTANNTESTNTTSSAKVRKKNTNELIVTNFNEDIVDTIDFSELIQEEDN